MQIHCAAVLPLNMGSVAPVDSPSQDRDFLHEDCCLGLREIDKNLHPTYLQSFIEIGCFERWQMNAPSSLNMFSVTSVHFNIKAQQVHHGSLNKWWKTV